MQVPGMFGSQPSIAQAEKKAKEKKPVDRTKEFQDEDREHRQKAVSYTHLTLPTTTYV